MSSAGFGAAAFGAEVARTPTDPVGVEVGGGVGVGVEVEVEVGVEVEVEVEVARVLADPSTCLSSVPSGLRPVMFEVEVGAAFDSSTGGVGPDAAQ